MRALSFALGAALFLAGAPSWAQDGLPPPHDFLAPSRAPAPATQAGARLGTTWRDVVRQALGAVQRLDEALERVEAAPAFEGGQPTTIFTFRGDVRLENSRDGLTLERGAVRTGPVPLAPDIPVAGDGRDPRGQVLGARITLPWMIP